jgi:hypothetical protein
VSPVAREPGRQPLFLARLERRAYRCANCMAERLHLNCLVSYVAVVTVCVGVFVDGIQNSHRGSEPKENRT